MTDEIKIVKGFPMPISRVGANGDRVLAKRKYDLPSLEVGDALIVPANDIDHGKKVQRSLMSAIHWYRSKVPQFRSATRIMANEDDGSITVGLWRLDDRIASVSPLPARRRRATT